MSKAFRLNTPISYYGGKQRLVRAVEQIVSVNAKGGCQKRKVEVFTANYKI